MLALLVFFAEADAVASCLLPLAVLPLAVLLLLAVVGYSGGDTALNSAAAVAWLP